MCWEQRRRAKQARRKVRRQRRALPPARDAADIDVTVAKGALELVASDVQVGSGETSTSGHEHVCGAGAIPSAGKKRDLESGSDSELVVAGDTDALAIVPLTPDDDHGGSVRRSPREHKKPKPYFELASTSLSVPKAKQGLKSASAMLLWAEDVDIPLDTARQAVQHVHAQHMSLVTQHGTASHVALPQPLQSLMVEAIRAVTGDASFTPLPGTDQPLSPEPPPLASESAPRRSSRARHPVTPYWTVPWGGLELCGQ
ncbi:hypothetical protein ABBQ32_006037 [Trebouxia sp. C0010 RCD-2024]